MFFLFEIVIWIFWTLVFQTFTISVKLLLFFVPTAWVKAELVGRLEECGVTTTSDPKQAGIYDKRKFKAQMVVHNDKFFKRLVYQESLALGEFYMDGSYECDDLVAYVNAALKPPLSLPQLLYDRVALATNNQTIGALSLRVMDDHYNLGNDLYENLLDETMN